MNDCERYRSNPDEHAAHVDSCGECRALTVELDELEQKVSQLGLEPKSDFQRQLNARLPLAPWEGARHRSWGLAIAVLTTLLILAIGAFLAAGVNSIGAIRTLGATMIPLRSPWELATSFASLVSSAPASFHLTVGILFVVVNVVLLVLLRRPPKGYDA